MKAAAKTGLRKRLALPAGIAALMVSAAPISAQTPGADGFAPKRFAFLPHFFLDLDRKSEHDETGRRPYAVRDCATSEVNCLRGRIFRVAWPKNCLNIYEGAVWKTPAVTTQVVGSFSRPGHYVDTVYFVAKSDGVSNTLYLLRRGAGLVGVIHDPRKRGLLANADQLPNLLTELASKAKITGNGYTASYLAGFGAVGVCRPPEDAPSTQ